MTMVRDYRDAGPRVGEPFPDIRLPDQHGSVVDLHAARGSRRAIVVFYRSARW
jgi:peroxiredoxin